MPEARTTSEHRVFRPSFLDPRSTNKSTGGGRRTVANRSTHYNRPCEAQAYFLATPARISLLSSREFVVIRLFHMYKEA